jgi:hypothetical protein
MFPDISWKLPRYPRQLPVAKVCHRINQYWMKIADGREGNLDSFRCARRLLMVLKTA